MFEGIKRWCDARPRVKRAAKIGFMVKCMLKLTFLAVIFYVKFGKALFDDLQDLAVANNPMKHINYSDVERHRKAYAF